MTPRRGLGVLSLTAALSAALVAVGVPQAGADAPTKTAWFSAAGAGPLTVPVPTTDAGDLRVGGTGESPTAYAALNLQSAGATGGTLTLQLRPGTALGTVALAACKTEKTDWEKGGNQSFDAGPGYDCSTGSAPGTLSDDGASVVFELDETTQSAPGTWDLAIAPAPEVTQPFTVDITTPDTQTFAPSAESGTPSGLGPPPAVTTDEPTAEDPGAAPAQAPPSDAGLTAGSETPVEAPATAPLEAPGPDLAGADTPLAPETAPGEEPVAAGDPLAQQTTALPATTPAASGTDSVGRSRLLALLALVAVCAAAGWAAGQQRPIPQLLGGRARAMPATPAVVPVPAAPTLLERGIGRFSRVRDAAPRRLR